LHYRINIYFESFVKSVNLNIKNFINSCGLVYVDVEVKVSGRMKEVAVSFCRIVTVVMLSLVYMCKK
jgi:hypothetical protein